MALKLVDCGSQGSRHTLRTIQLPWRQSVNFGFANDLVHLDLIIAEKGFVVMANDALIQKTEALFYRVAPYPKGTCDISDCAVSETVSKQWCCIG